MAKYNKFNIVYQLQKWMDSVAGQTFMNYAYSWGAAVVILGTLFKLTHLDGANLMLFIGMGTEVFVFFISAFDRPFDKTADGRDLATDSQLAAAALAATAGQTANGSLTTPAETGAADTIAMPAVEGNNMPSGTIVVGNITPQVAQVSQAPQMTDSTNGGTIIIGQSVVPSAGSNSQPISFSSSEDIKTTPEIQPENTATIPSTGINANVIGAPAPAVSPETAEAMEEATSTYVDRLNELNELLLKVGAQSERLTTDSQEMENLNRTLTGIARVYEMQLKSASQQITTQDEINEQTRKMAQQIQELNSIYARMIEAMTTNMPK